MSERQRRIVRIRLALLAVVTIGMIGAFGVRATQPMCERDFCSILLPFSNGAELVTYWGQWEIGAYVQRYTSGKE